MISCGWLILDSGVFCDLMVMVSCFMLGCLLIVVMLLFDVGVFWLYWCWLRRLGGLWVWVFWAV